jgi:hypothetical protein
MMQKRWFETDKTEAALDVEHHHLLNVQRWDQHFPSAKGDLCDGGENLGENGVGTPTEDRLIG